jgi:serine/threonine-protein kinase HipA
MAERLAVLLHNQVIGHLERASEQALPILTYDADYVSSGFVPLSLRLPITERPYPAAKVEPYLQGLLPENHATRERWARRLGTTPDDAFGILAVMGWDCPGAVQFCDPDNVDALRSRAGEYQPVNEAEIAGRLRELADQPTSWTIKGEHWSLGGQQEKFALAMIDGGWHLAHGSAATTHIVKPGIKYLHHQALVEHVTIAAAGALGVDVAETRIAGFEDQWAIVVSRFDRLDGPGGTIERIHQEDFCQATGRLPAAKYEARGGPQLADLASLVRRQSTDQDDDLLALADFAVVNLVAGAPDGHSKNISLLLAPGGERWVGPLYDLATGLAYDSETVERKVALSIGGERIFSRIRTKQWEKAATALGLSAELLMTRVQMMAEEYPAAFEAELAAIADIPGVDEVAERTLPNLRQHCLNLLSQLD